MKRTLLERLNALEKKVVCFESKKDLDDLKINIKNQYGKYPLDAAISNKHQDVIDYLTSNGAHSNVTDIS